MSADEWGDRRCRHGPDYPDPVPARLRDVLVVCGLLACLVAAAWAGVLWALGLL